MSTSQILLSVTNAKQMLARAMWQKAVLGARDPVLLNESLLQPLMTSLGLLKDFQKFLQAFFKDQKISTQRR